MSIPLLNTPSLIPPLVNAINWNRIEDDKDLEVWNLSLIHI